MQTGPWSVSMSRELKEEREEGALTLEEQSEHTCGEKVCLADRPVCMCGRHSQLLSHAQLFVTLWMVACQAPPSL